MVAAMSRAWLILIALAACGATPHTGTRCFREGVPPPKRVDPAHTLIVGIGPAQRSPAACPADHPAVGTACTLRDADECYYEHAGAPCDPDVCTCKDGVFACEDRITIE